MYLCFQVGKSGPIIPLFVRISEVAVTCCNINQLKGSMGDMVEVYYSDQLGDNADSEYATIKQVSQLKRM